MLDFSNPKGLECMIMQNDSDADRVIALFESAAVQGYDPVEVEAEVYKQARVNPANFTVLDRQKIQKAVNDIWYKGAYLCH